jgi:hypothetical protein
MIDTVQSQENQDEDPIGTFKKTFLSKHYRNSLESFKVFCDRFLRTVMPCSVYDMNRHKEPVSYFTSVSDESFVLIALHNGYQNWKSKALLEVWKRQQPKTPTQEEINNYLTKHYSEPKHPPTLWTNLPNAKKYCGWDKAGVELFNTYLSDKVPTKRAKTKELEQDFLNYAKDKGVLGGKDRQSPPKKTTETVVALNELTVDWRNREVVDNIGKRITPNKNDDDDDDSSNTSGEDGGDADNISDSGF